jgi:hypothetical protein
MGGQGQGRAPGGASSTDARVACGGGGAAPGWAVRAGGRDWRRFGWPAVPSTPSEHGSGAGGSGLGATPAESACGSSQALSRAARVGRCCGGSVEQGSYALDADCSGLGSAQLGSSPAGRRWLQGKPLWRCSRAAHKRRARDPALSSPRRLLRLLPWPADA